ncbi:hypothetical protein KAI04_03485 [Candidatus Pacearchaeota archaeon]|nr:hypothetical protein [Candidatus Pacearchaeota archaeon]
MKKPNKDIKKEDEMAKRNNVIDGWGLIILIIGLAMKFLSQDNNIANVGLLLIIVGVIRIFYVLIKHG